MVGDKIRDSVDALSGVLQGTVLGPLLIICYTNDLPNTIESKIRMYADDTLVYSTIKTHGSVSCGPRNQETLGVRQTSVYFT